MLGADVHARSAPKTDMNLKRVLFAASVLVVGVFLFWSSRTWGFKGDGKLRYLGPFRPSYELKLRAIPLGQPGEYRYSFRGLPSQSDINFVLYVVGKSTKDRQELEDLKMSMEATITNGSGELLCTVSGTPGGAPWGPERVKWVLESGPDEAAFWHDNCVHFQTHNKPLYTLVVRIRDVDPHAPNTALIPTLEGGGAELP
jgi:hypothetical protein